MQENVNSWNLATPWRARLSEKITLNQNLLSFLLIISDTAQECGRLDNEENVKIFNFEVYDHTIDLGLIYEREKYFKSKIDELKTVFDHIISENYTFKLTIKYGNTTFSKQSRIS